MTVHSNKQTASTKNVTLTTASAAALGALAGSSAALGQAGEAFSLEKTPDLIVPDAPKGGEGAKLPMQGEISVDEHLIVDLHVVDEELADVLQMLSIQSQRNIVASRNVAATVTATLYGVTFYEALDAILHVNGFGYVEEGNFIYVYTAEEIKTLIEDSRQRTTAVIPLDYINSSDAAEFAQALLSENGQIKAPGKTAQFSIPDNAPVGADDMAAEAFIVVVDFEENVDAIRDLLVQIDTKPSQVLVEATILQAALTENNAFGVDFSIIGNMNFGDFLGGPLNAANNLLNGEGEDRLGNPVSLPSSDNGNANAVNTSIGRVDGPASLKAGVVAGDFAAFLRVLDEVTDTTIIARPKVLTLNRQPARVLVGERVGYLSSTTTQTGTTQTVEFLDTGTQLYFRPFISRDGLIRMELKPQVSEAVIRDATDSGGSAVTIPDETTNELTANVMVRDGQTIVLGGLFRERTQYTRRQLPWIADLPIIGAPFRGREDSTDRAEIIFMITPTIVNDQIMSEHAERAKELIDSAVAGTREGLLPFSRDKQASRLLVEAQQHAGEGNNKKALYCVRRSLSLNPNQPQARALLERLTSNTRDWPTMSVLESTFNTELDLYLDEHGDLFEPTPVDLGAEGASLMFDDETLTTASDVKVIESIDGEPMVESTGPVATETTETTTIETLATENSTDSDIETIDPAVAEAEALAATEDTFDDTELADARESETGSEVETSETAFESSDWIGSLAKAEIGAAADATETPVETTKATEPEPQTPAIVYDADARTFDIEVEDAALPTLIRDLAKQSRQNIVLPKELSGSVTTTMFGVNIYEALDVLLHDEGFGYVEEGSFIHVYSHDQIQAMAADAASLEAEKTTTETIASADEPETPTDLEVVDTGSTTTSTNAPTSIATAETKPTGTTSTPSTTKATGSTTKVETPAPVGLSPDFDESSPIEAQIDDTLGEALLGSLSFSEFEWSPTVTRDGFTEPTSWVGSDAGDARASTSENNSQD